MSEHKILPHTRKRRGLVGCTARLKVFDRAVRTWLRARWTPFSKTPEGLRQAKVLSRKPKVAA